MPTAMDMRDIDKSLEPEVLSLNNEHAAELTWLEAEDLSRLVGKAFHARICGGQRAFMIGFDQDADYHSPNFLWFRERYPRFAYVDRIAVAAEARGRGLARTLYDDFFTRAKAAGHTLIACEVNSDPPNPASDAFHSALGFRVVGTAEIYGGKRTVRYYIREL